MSAAPQWLQNSWADNARAERNREQRRSEDAERTAFGYFADATKPQKATFDATMKVLIGCTGPRWDRARTEAKAKYARTTQQARALYDLTLDEILRDGEVSEATEASWSALTGGELDRQLAAVRDVMASA